MISMKRNGVSATRSRAIARRRSPALPAFWARLIALPESPTAAALEALADVGELRRQPLGTDLFYIADPPHAPQR
jgi:hypothetical protein